MKKLILLLIIPLFFSCVKSNKKENVTSFEKETVTPSKEEYDISEIYSQYINLNQVRNWEYHDFPCQGCNRMVFDETGSEITGYVTKNVLGEKKYVGFIQAGFKQGQWLDWYDTGELKEKINYNNNLKHGTSYVYYKNGKIEGEVSWHMGFRCGWAKSFCENGKVWAQGFWSCPYEESYGKKQFVKSGWDRCH